MTKEDYTASGLTVKAAIQTLLDNDLTELFTNLAEVVAARDGESSLLVKLQTLVSLTGAQTIAGVKTFSSDPILSALTASRVMVSSTTKELNTSGITVTELAYLNGVTSAIQTQLTANAGAITAVSSVEVGSEILWPLDTPPTGYLEEDGSSLLRVGAYADLFAVIGTIHGTADSTHFNLPDSRGQFLRVWDNGASNDPNAATRTASIAVGATMSAGDHVGTEQIDGFKAHAHSYVKPTGGGTLGGAGPTANATNSNTESTGGDETRPINTNRMLCMKY